MGVSTTEKFGNTNNLGANARIAPALTNARQRDETICAEMRV